MWKGLTSVAVGKCASHLLDFHAESTRCTLEEAAMAFAFGYILAGDRVGPRP
jgi:hypothetical protein